MLFFSQLSDSCDRNINFDFPPIPSIGKALLHSAFVSWVVINSFYLPLYDYGFVLENENNPQANFIEWFPKGLNVDSLNRCEDFRFSPYHSNLLNLIRAAKSNGSEVVILTNIFNPKFSEEENPDWRHYKHYCGLYNSIKERLSLSENVHLIDLREVNVPDASWIDDCHLNELGHRLIAWHVKTGIDCLVDALYEESRLDAEADTALSKNDDSISP